MFVCKVGTGLESVRVPGIGWIRPLPSGYEYTTEHRRPRKGELYLSLMDEGCIQQAEYDFLCSCFWIVRKSI